MGMSTHVVAFREADEKWHKMKAVWDVCEESGVPIPDAVLGFFDYESPDPAGVEIEIPKHEWTNGDTLQDGFEVHLDEIPKDVKVIRFYNSW